jgi:hypothetical protein
VEEWSGWGARGGWVGGGGKGARVEGGGVGGRGGRGAGVVLPSQSASTRSMAARASSLERPILRMASPSSLVSMTPLPSTSKAAKASFISCTTCLGLGLGSGSGSGSGPGLGSGPGSGVGLGVPLHDLFAQRFHCARPTHHARRRLVRRRARHHRCCCCGGAPCASCVVEGTQLPLCRGETRVGGGVAWLGSGSVGGEGQG